ncbi:MAG TPA: cyclic nucleotide-binding domain-containing protein [Acidimicrobiales bacterium]|nr:cyclic nucleotide-binding domain-containing protein [Acidimicrobiales bacterium]
MASLGSLGRARKIELLRRIPLFSTCTQRELAEVATLTVEATFRKDAVLTREGQSGGIAFVIASGTAEVVRGGKRLARLGEGDVVGELSLIDGQPRSATVRATSDLEVLEIAAVDLRRLLKRAPSVVRKLLEAMSLRLRETDALVTAST